MTTTFDATRFTSDRRPAEPKVGPKVPLPSFGNVMPKPATTVSLAGAQYDTVRRQLSSSGLNDAALGAVEAGYASIDKQRSGGRRY
jgi:hypothetical protein